MPKRSGVTFTDSFVRRAKAAAGAERTAYYDALTPGLELRVSADGTKAWGYRYRDGAGRTLRLSLGLFPAVALKAARDEALEARASVRKGGDPQAERQSARANAKAQRIRTLGDLCDAFLEHAEANFRPATVAGDRQRIESHIRPKLGAVRAEGVSRAQVRELVNDIGKGQGGYKGRKAAPVTANRTATLIARLYSFAAAHLDMTLTNPAKGMQSTFDEATRERTLADDELRDLWGVLDAPASLGVATLSPIMALCLKACALTLQRANEVAGLHEAELNLEQRTWTLPAARTKNGREHVVPLSPEAVAVLTDALALRPIDPKTGKPLTRLLFPSPRDPAKPLTRRAVTRAMTRVCDAIADAERAEHIKAGGDPDAFTAPLADAGPHDLRRTGATAITSERIGIPRFTVSLVLGHRSETGGVTGVYDRNAYLSEKRRALEAWATLLVSIVNGAARGENVVTLRGASEAG